METLSGKTEAEIVTKAIENLGNRYKISENQVKMTKPTKKMHW